MKANIVKILWGIVLIAVGGLSLADTLGYVHIELLNHRAWAIAVAGLSAFFFLCYFLAGMKKWGWLIPALLFAALALVIGLFLDHPNDYMVALPILLSIGIPFYVGYFVDRKNWGLLIPAWVMTVIPIILVLANSAYPDLVGAVVLYAIALPFLMVYLANRQHKWALIVGAVLAFIGLFPLLGPILPDAIAGPVVMFLIALPFFTVYFASKKSWWAFIPAGVFSSIGVVALLDMLLPNNTYFQVGELEFGVYTGVLLFGFAATFGVLWLRRMSQPTAWASYPAIILLVLSILSFFMWKTASDLVPALTLLIAGIALIITAVIRRGSSRQPAS